MNGGGWDGRGGGEGAGTNTVAAAARRDERWTSLPQSATSKFAHLFAQAFPTRLRSSTSRFSSSFPPYDQ